MKLALIEQKYDGVIQKPKVMARGESPGLIR